MLNVLCDKCNGNMVIETTKTFQEYARELGYVVLEGGEIAKDSLQDYVIYKCSSCDTIKKYSLKDLEFQFRRAIAFEALKHRMVMNKTTLDKVDIDFDSKMFYCGKCVGIDEDNHDGYCLDSIAKYCRIYKGLKT